MSRLALTLLLTLFASVDALAASTLLDYEQRVVNAAEQIERIKADEDYKEEGTSHIRGLLPRSELVQFEGGEMTVDNTWLYVLLDSFKAEKDPQQRVSLLNEAAGRLRALDDHLRSAEAEEPDQSDNPRDRIREILSRPAFQPEQETAVGKLIKSVLKRVRNFMGELYSTIRSFLERLFGTSASSEWISNVVLILVLATAVIIVARYAGRLRRPQIKRKKTRLVLGEEIAADGTSLTLAEAGLAAARAGDFRTAMRKLYVSLLYELSERNLIELDDSATNHEYLSKASRHSGLGRPMQYLTDRFDYVWYGMFPSSESDFAVYHQRYEEAMERARVLSEQAAGVS